MGRKGQREVNISLVHKRAEKGRKGRFFFFGSEKGRSERRVEEEGLETVSD